MAHMDKARPQFVFSVSPSQRAALETCLSLVDSSHDRGSRRPWFIILFHLNPTSVQNELDMSGWSTFHTPTRAESRMPIVNGFELLYVCVCVCVGWVSLLLWVSVPYVRNAHLPFAWHGFKFSRSVNESLAQSIVENNICPLYPCFMPATSLFFEVEDIQHKKNTDDTFRVEMYITTCPSWFPLHGPSLRGISVF